MISRSTLLQPWTKQRPEGIFFGVTLFFVQTKETNKQTKKEKKNGVRMDVTKMGNGEWRIVNIDVH